MIDYDRINNTMGKMAFHLSKHNSICVSVSGGSDSDILVHIIATYFREFLPKIHFVFVNTGLEYQATKDHLNYLEDKYTITIDRIRGKSVVWAVKNYGVPVLSKDYSDKVMRYMRGADVGIKWYNGYYQNGSPRPSKFVPSPKEKALADKVKANALLVSKKCCDVSKKKPLHDYQKRMNCDMVITGERAAEGGLRATSHNDCFEKAHTHPWDKYMPLFFWNDETKQIYKETEGIRYSDCYEVWGMKRTGCVGCPYNSKAGAELMLIKQYEPKVYKACVNVFGKSYLLTEQVKIHRAKMPEEIMQDLSEMYPELIKE